MFDRGMSTLRWPDGKHNTLPSKAVDFQPYPLPGKKSLQFAALAYLASAAIQIGKQEGIALRWGGDWNSNGDVTDQNFYDLWHLEIVETINENTSTNPPVADTDGTLYGENT
jgi:hypothetical protein